MLKQSALRFESIEDSSSGPIKCRFQKVPNPNSPSCSVPFQNVTSGFLERFLIVVVPKAKQIVRATQALLKSQIPKIPSRSTTAKPSEAAQLQLICSDPNRQYRSCGPACPPGCGLRANCSRPCISGCFCKHPLILKNHTDGLSPCVAPTSCAQAKRCKCHATSDQ